MIPMEVLGQDPSRLFQLLVVPASLACGHIPPGSVCSHGLLTLSKSQIWGCTRNTHTWGSSQHGYWISMGGLGLGKTKKSRQGERGRELGGRLSYDPLEAASITPATFCWSKK